MFLPIIIRHPWLKMGTISRTYPKQGAEFLNVPVHCTCYWVAAAVE